MVKSPHEYDGATVLPYTDHRYKSESKVFVRAYKEFGHRAMGTNAAPIGHLKIFFEDMPLLREASTVSSVGHAPDPLFAIFIDHDRFTGADASIDSHDDFYLIDIRGTRPAFHVRKLSDGSFKIVGTADYHAPKSCTQESTYIWRCNGELRIPLLASDLAAPGQDVEPGIGFEVFPFEVGNTLTVKGGLPEDEVKDKTIAKLTSNRTLAMSLLFGEPKGFDADFMTWNIRRSAMSKLAGRYQPVADQSIGTWIGTNTGARSIIALQEAWNRTKFSAVREAADNARTAQGLGKLQWVGPPDFFSPLRGLMADVGGVTTGIDGTTGGLYTLSALQIKDSGYLVFSADACKGEDCFKAKGVLWTRIQLNPETAAKAECEVKHAIADGPPCDTPPSGAEYVDVFNTHLDSPKPELCTPGPAHGAVMANIAQLLLQLPDAKTTQWLISLQDTDLNCLVSDQVIEERELDEMNAFIESHADPSRPAIIMGDFNIDGRALGSSDSEYPEILKRLHIGPQQPKSLDTDDLVNPWPTDFDWDIDHGDLARQYWADLGSSYPSDGHCMGTFLGDDPIPVTSGCTLADGADGKSRFDYILVRPPKQSDDINFTAANWVVEKRSNISMWHSPYPNFSGPSGGQFDGPPDRLSDHKPVFSSLAFAKLVVPHNFHPDWKHHVEFRVTSADASNRGDASGPVDLTVKNYGGHVPLGGGRVSLTRTATTVTSVRAERAFLGPPTAAWTTGTGPCSMTDRNRTCSTAHSS